MNDDELEDDVLDSGLDRLVQFLPEPLRADWVVVPRGSPNRILVVGLLLGAGLALTVVGMVYGLEGLEWGWPIGLGLLALLSRFAPWWREDRHQAQLRWLVEQDASSERSRGDG